MLSIDLIRQLFDFNDWANRRVIAALRRADCPPAARYMSHVLTTEKEYYERLFGKDSTGFDFWPESDVEGLSGLAKQNALKYERLLKGFDDEGLGQRADYKTSAGEPVFNSFRDMLTHVILHSMNHRGQVLTILRQDGHEPPEIDYIIYRREIQ